MSSLGRLRQVLPLASRLAQAPGACRQIGDLASSLPGRGRGGGAPSEPSDSPAPGSKQHLERLPRHGSPQETASTDSRYSEEVEQPAVVTAAAREPGAQQQQQQQQQRQQQAGAGPRRGKGKRPVRGPKPAAAVDSEEEENEELVAAEGDEEEQQDEQQQQRQRQQQRGGRERRLPGQLQSGSQDVDLYEEIHLQIPDPEDPTKSVTVPAAEVFTEAELGIDPSRLWLLKYVLGPSGMERLMSGAMGPGELEEAAAKIEATVVPTPEELESQLRQYMQVNVEDPHYRIMDGVGKTPRVGPDPTLGTPASLRLPRAAKVLEAHKQELMELMGVDEEEFEYYKAEVGAEFSQLRKVVRFKPMPRDYEARLYKLLERSVPADHPMYSTIKSKLDVVAANPQWPGDRKIVFAKRLIKTVTGAKAL